MLHLGSSETRSDTAATPFSADKPVPVKRRLVLASIGAITYIGAGFLVNVSQVVESVYAVAVGPPVAWTLSRITGVLPFSVTEVVYVAYASWLLFVTWRTLVEVFRKQRSIRNALLGGGTRLARDAGIIVFLFYTMWGFNYSRPSLEHRFAWPAWTPGDVDELVTVSHELVDAGNALYREIHGSEDAGTPTALPGGMADVHNALESAWATATARLALPATMRWRYGKSKYLASSAIYARLGITGFYFPFTAEANVRWGLPALSLPQSVAHEKAHQRGIASEDEASFLGFVAGALSDDPYIRYSSIMFAERQMTSALARADRALWREVTRRRLPGVQRDVDDLTEYFRRFIGVGTAVGRSVNDRFLRANRVEGGVLSYGRVARLLITFSREQQGTIIPLRP